MANIKLVSTVVKRRARRVFSAIDEGADPSTIKQHKLRQVIKDRLYYHWRSHCGGKRKHTPAGFRAFLEVRRDCLGRLYIKELPDLGPSLKTRKRRRGGAS